MDKTNNWFHDLFINEAKPALKRHSGNGGSSNPITEPITITENGFYPVPKGEGGLEYGKEVQCKAIIPLEDIYAFIDSVTLSSSGGMGSLQIIDGGLLALMYFSDIECGQFMLAGGDGAMYTYVFNIEAGIASGKTNPAMNEDGWWAINMSNGTTTKVSEPPTITIPTGATVNPDLESISFFFDIETKSLDGWGDITVNVQNEILNIAYGDTAPEDTSKLWVKTTQPSKVKVASELNMVERDDTSIIELGITHKQDYIVNGAQVENKVWMPSGYQDVGYSNRIYYFDTETETVTRSPAVLPASTYYAGVYAIGTNVYIVGGYSGNASIDKIYVLDTVTQTVSTSSIKLPKPISSVCGVVYDGKIYVFAPCENVTIDGTNAIWCIDTETGTLTTLSFTLPMTFSPYRAVVHENCAFIFGGYSGSGNLTSIIKVDFSAETATLLDVTVPFAASTFTACNYKGQIYLFYGMDIYTFDVASEVFTKLSLRLPKNKGSAMVGMSDQALYLIAGQDNGYSASSVILKLLIGMVIDLPADTLQILSTLDRNIFKLINTDKVQTEIGVDKVYKGNEKGIGEQVEAALHNGTKWVNI